MMSQNEALHAICMSLSVKMALGVGLFTNAVNSMGTERHQSIFQAAWNREVCHKALLESQETFNNVDFSFRLLHVWQ